MSKHCRVLICDDRKEFRDLVKAMIKRTPGIEVAGEAGDGRASVDRALELRPDVVLMDVNMPAINGLEATRRIHAADSHIRVLILSAFGEESVEQFLEAGASGYLQKYRCLTELADAIETVRRGHRYLSAGVLEGVRGA